MEVNRTNYEAYFLDYFEKKLFPEEVAELMVFLEENPDLKDEFESFAEVILPVESHQFTFKNTLKKKEFKATEHINSFNYENYMVGSIEGNLSQAEKEELGQFLIVNPTAKLEYGYFKKVILQAESIELNNKESLKKKKVYFIRSKQFIYSLSAAAAILIVIALYFGLMNTIPSADQRINNLNQQLVYIKFNTFDIKQSGKNVEKVALRNRESDNLKASLIAGNEMIADLQTFTIPGMNTSPVENIEFTGQPINTIVYRDDFDNMADLTIEQQQRSFIARFLSSILSRQLQSARPSQKSFLEITVQSYNALADRNVDVEKQYDADGNIVAYNVKGDVISFSRKVNPRTTE